MATFAKYYGRWACVGKPVLLDATHRLMLQAVKAELNPYIVDDFERDPFVVIVPADTCKEKGFYLMRDEEYRYKKLVKGRRFCLVMGVPHKARNYK